MHRCPMRAEHIRNAREDKMDQKQIAKQMIQFNKTAFDNSFNAMTMVYEQNEKMITAFLDQAAWLPEDGKKAITEWLQAYKKGCADFKGMVEDNYQKVEDFFCHQIK
jgi:ABC-type glycerol-3-phosphate transport system substrate-binding protein